MFEQSENVTIAHFFIIVMRAAAVRGVAYAMVGSKFIWLSSAHAYCINGQS
jgi:hypothetical protein